MRTKRTPVKKLTNSILPNTKWDKRVPVKRNRKNKPSKPWTKSMPSKTYSKSMAIKT